MLHTKCLEGVNDIGPADREQFIIDAAWAIHSTHHTISGSFPAAALSRSNMMFDLPYQTD